MRYACSRTVKSTFADTTLVWSMVRVDVLVYFECVHPLERFSAHIAMELHHIGVRQPMIFVRSKCLERLSAFLATILPIVTVRDLVFGQIVSGVRRIRALIALERLFAQMDSHVDLAFAGGEKASFAVVRQTRIRPVTGVVSHMRL